MGIITENWDAYTRTPGESAHRQFFGSDFANEEAFRGSLPVQPGNTHDRDRSLIAGKPSISTPKGPGLFVADIDYAANAGKSGGDSGSSDDLNKLKLPPDYVLIVGEESLPIDRDIHNNPLTNSALDPWSSPYVRPFTTLFYEYTRWEVRYNGPQALAYRNKINSDRTLIPGFGWINPGQGLCKMPRLTGPINRDSKVVQVKYLIELDEFGFQARYLDKGQQAFYAKDQPAGPLFSGEQQVTTDVLLNGKGIPIKDGYKIKVSSAMANPFAIAALPKEVKIESGPLATYLKYDVLHSRPFAALELIP